MKILDLDLDVEVLGSGLVRFREVRKRGRIRKGYRICGSGLLEGIIRFLDRLQKERISVRHIDRPVLVALVKHFFECSNQKAYDISNFLILLQRYYK